MAIALNTFLCAILLAALCALLGIIDASRRPAYTFADWQRASDRICRGIGWLSSARCLSLGRRVHRQTYSALLKDLHANTTFVLNVANDSCCGPFRRPLDRPELMFCASDLLNQSVGLLLRLHLTRLRLFIWPTATRALRRHALAAVERHTGLCLALADFLEHYVN